MANNNVTMIEKDMSQVTTKQKIVKIVATTLIYAFLIIMALIVLFPFYWMINSSLKSLEEYRLGVPTLYPHVIHFDNYRA